jgi:methyl-accepting chemotaxis protein
MGGPIQLQSQQASDLMADILPPPVFIIETFLEVTLLRNNPAEIAAHRPRLETLRREFAARMQYWSRSDIDPLLRETLTTDAAQPAEAFWMELDAGFLPALAAGKRAAIDKSYAVLQANYVAHRQKIDAAVIQAKRYRTSLDAHGAARGQQVSAQLIILCLLFLGLVAAASSMILSRLVAPLARVAEATRRLALGEAAAVPCMDRGDELGEIAKAVETFRMAAVTRALADADRAAEQQTVVDALVLGLATLAEGDMTTKIEADFPPAFAEAKENFQCAVENLRHMIQAVIQNTDSIRTGTDEIARASEDLARRTESNAASLEQTSAALVQIDGRLKTTTAAAVDTVMRADRTIATVGSGRATAGEAVAAMGRVSGSAIGIDSVIEGLDKIAFQTRVLAMNAAVEAGRAGDAGRGFAVVADLVSALAMRAEEEAKRARDQLGVTQAEIGNAVDAVHRVDNALATIAGDVDEVHALLRTIADDNNAQSLAITEISVAISGMDRSTQQNAAMVEETSAATQTLNAEVAQLAESAAAFKWERRVRASPVAVDRRDSANRAATKQPVPQLAPKRLAPFDDPAPLSAKPWMLTSTRAVGTPTRAVGTPARAVGTPTRAVGTPTRAVGTPTMATATADEWQDF